MMTTIIFESTPVSPDELQAFLKDARLEYSLENTTGPHRGATETIIHFVTENLETIKFFTGIFGAFNMWLEFKRYKLEEQKNTREAELHQVEMELKQLEVLEKRAALRVTLKNNEVFVLTNGPEEEVARQLELEKPGLKPNQIKRVKLE